jgi:hypothetical protein
VGLIGGPTDDETILPSLQPGTWPAIDSLSLEDWRRLDDRLLKIQLGEVSDENGQKFVIVSAWDEFGKVYVLDIKDAPDR